MFSSELSSDEVKMISGGFGVLLVSGCVGSITANLAERLYDWYGGVENEHASLAKSCISGAGYGVGTIVARKLMRQP